MDSHYKAAKVQNIPINNDAKTYTIQEINTRDIHQYLAEELLDHDPTTPPSDTPMGTHPFPHL
jgi:hypothetical protein